MRHLYIQSFKVIMTKIIGISAFYHDSAVALIEDGKIIYASQEERFSRKKHDASFPYLAAYVSPNKKPRSAKRLPLLISTTSCSREQEKTIADPVFGLYKFGLNSGNFNSAPS